MKEDALNIGERLRAVREEKKLSQGDIEGRTGLLRCYVSRVENCHTVPAIETLEKFARALEMPLYQLLYDGNVAPLAPVLVRARTSRKGAWGTSGKGLRYLNKLRALLRRMPSEDRKILLFMVSNIAARSGEHLTPARGPLDFPSLPG